MMRTSAIGLMFAVLLALTPSTALAHLTDDGHQEPGDWQAWRLDPLVLLVLTVFASAYVRGQRRRLSRARAQAAAYGTGLVVLLVALSSPIDPLGEELLAVHMVQHMLLVQVAAPLIAVARPEEAARRLIAPVLRRRRVRRLLREWVHMARRVSPAQLPFTLALYAGALLLWHVPALHEAALSNQAAHIAQHLSFVVTAVLFWAASFRAFRRSGQPALSFASIFLLSVVSGALGALMTFARLGIQRTGRRSCSGALLRLRTRGPPAC